MCKIKVIIKAGSIFHHHSKRNNINNLKIDEDVEVEVEDGLEIHFNTEIYRLGIFSNNYLPNFINNQAVILKKDTKYINTNSNEDSLGFTKKLEVEQKVYFNSGTVIEIPVNTPMHSLCGKLNFILSSPIIVYAN